LTPSECWKNGLLAVNQRHLKQDNGDNHLIELAVTGYAQGIVSRNIKDLQSSELLFPDILLMTPEELLQGGPA